MSPTKGNSFSAGFSLIELLIALFILTVSILGLVSVTLTSIRANNQNEVRNTAIRLSSEKAENLIAEPINSANLTDGNHASTVQATVRGISQSYNLTYNVRTLSGDLKEIRINILYNFRGQQYSHNSVIYKHRTV